MSSATYVATLIASEFSRLQPADLKKVQDHITSSGATVQACAWRSPDLVADIFFSGDFAWRYDFPFDVIIQRTAGRLKKALIADMESTIIQEEMLDELAALAGKGEQTAKLTRQAMNGEIDFETALRQRIFFLKGMHVDVLREASARMTLSPGAQALVSAMRSSGALCVLVSGGFSFFVEQIAQKLNFEKFFANSLIFEDDTLTGKIISPVLTQHTKLEILKSTCDLLGCSAADCAVIGDGANDIPMLEFCQTAGGLSVAYRAKPRVREAIRNQINHSDLRSLVWAQGLAL